MGKAVHYTIEPPDNFQDLVDLYEALGWNSLHLSKDELQQMCSESLIPYYQSLEYKKFTTGMMM
ncbi:hypothetical protein FPZ44_06020 [Paenibacillus agilis]|uniref:Uncharacterized protein n=1 Tax=Paenibacillus agilis TaxID=3020863 RepID=A0A559IYH2_9BACL|nr:hypothetical protein FPZ44_06020 [Paenibacillus agilis]